MVWKCIHCILGQSRFPSSRHHQSQYDRAISAHIWRGSATNLHFDASRFLPAICQLAHVQKSSKDSRCGARKFLYHILSVLPKCVKIYISINFEQNKLSKATNKWIGLKKTMTTRRRRTSRFSTNPPPRHAARAKNKEWQRAYNSKKRILFCIRRETKHNVSHT